MARTLLSSSIHLGAVCHLPLNLTLKYLARKQSRKHVKELAWKEWSIYVRSKDADWRGYAICFTCRKPYKWKELQAGHYRHNKLDFEPLNIHPQCVRCNKWLHGNLDSYSLWLTRTYGPEILETINGLERDWKPETSADLQAIYLKYKELNQSPRNA